MGEFPLPVEVIPMAANHVKRIIEKDIGGQAILRDFTTDNGNQILEVAKPFLEILQPTMAIKF